MAIHESVRTATPEDMEPWMALVLEMAEFFPGLDEAAYRRTLAKNIARGSALCVWGEGRLAGVLLYSPGQSCLSFLAVRSAYRRRGIARALIERMLEAFPKGAEISVITYRQGDPHDVGARALYKHCGFVEDALLVEHGHPQQRFILRKKG